MQGLGLAAYLPVRHALSTGLSTAAVDRFPPPSVLAWPCQRPAPYIDRQAPSELGPRPHASEIDRQFAIRGNAAARSPTGSDLGSLRFEFEVRVLGVVP